MGQGASAEPSTQVEAGLARVRARFVFMLEDRADELYELLDYLDDPLVRETAYKEIQSRAHKLHGISGSIGFPRIGELAAQLEVTLEQVRSTDRTKNVQHVRRQLEDLLEEMERSVNDT